MIQRVLTVAMTEAPLGAGGTYQSWVAPGVPYFCWGYQELRVAATADTFGTLTVYFWILHPPPAELPDFTVAYNAIADAITGFWTVEQVISPLPAAKFVGIEFVEKGAGQTRFRLHGYLYGGDSGV